VLNWLSLSFKSYSSFQSGYRKFHSVETALLKIQNDLLLNIDSKRVTALIQLDMSAAFDTVDHSILLHRLSLNFGLSNSALEFLSSYLSNRSQFVKIGSSCSDISPLLMGVPQGSILGPLLFSLYTTPLSYLFDSSSISYHLYADDTQIYLSFSSDNDAFSLGYLSSTLGLVYQWLSANCLCVNPSKTEYVLVGTWQQCAKINNAALDFNSSILAPSSSVRSLGVIFDSELNMSKQISAVCSSCHYAIRQLHQVRPSLNFNSSKLLANALVSSKLDFCNSLYYGLPQNQIHRMQLVQNSLARVVCPGISRRDHISPILRSLHWLPVEQRIQYKLLVLSYKTLLYNQPTYLRDLLAPHTSVCSLRSFHQHSLTAPFVKSATGRRSFSYAAPFLWNKLPTHLRTAASLSVFRSQLKTYPFPP